MSALQKDYPELLSEYNIGDLWFLNRMTTWRTLKLTFDDELAQNASAKLILLINIYRYSTLLSYVAIFIFIFIAILDSKDSVQAIIIMFNFIGIHIK